MGWFAKVFGSVSPEDTAGIRLDDAAWEMHGPRTFSDLLSALRDVLPPGAVLYFEGGSPDEELRSFFAAHVVPEPQLVALGTVWPRPEVFHVPADPEVIDELRAIMAHHGDFELAVHFHVYCGSGVTVQWHDAFDLPIELSAAFTEEQVAAVSRALGTYYRRTA